MKASEATPEPCKRGGFGRTAGGGQGTSGRSTLKQVSAQLSSSTEPLVTLAML